MNTESSVRRIWSVVMVTVCLCLSLPGQAVQEFKADSGRASTETVNFESMINSVVRAKVPGEFGVVQRPRGALVEGVGYFFSFTINLNRAIINSPMGPVADPTAPTPAKRDEKIAELKTSLIELLYNNGATLKQLSSDKPIVIVGYFDQTSFETGGTFTKLTMSVLKRDVDESLARQVGLNAFRNKVKVNEYSGR